MTDRPERGYEEICEYFFKAREIGRLFENIFGHTDGRKRFRCLVPFYIHAQEKRFFLESHDSVNKSGIKIYQILSRVFDAPIEFILPVYLNNLFTSPEWMCERLYKTITREGIANSTKINFEDILKENFRVPLEVRDHVTQLIGFTWEGIFIEKTPGDKMVIRVCEELNKKLRKQFELKDIDHLSPSWERVVKSIARVIFCYVGNSMIKNEEYQERSGRLKELLELCHKCIPLGQHRDTKKNRQGWNVLFYKK